MSRRQLSFFDGERLGLEDAIQISLASLMEYGQHYRHWAVAYSGGKDSSATVIFVAWAILNGLVKSPESLTVLYADTRMELPPLKQTAMKLLETLCAQGFEARVVLPRLDKRFYVYMLGYGVPPPKNLFRWCTVQIKVAPMMDALYDLRQVTGQKLLMLTGVRLGESAARDQRIALSCSKDSGECGQGWFQTATDEAVADTLAPLLHWRVCHIYDWLYFEQERHGYDVSSIAAVYGEEDVRTGCVGCNLINRDTAIERLVRKPEWEHLRPLLELKPLYRELTKAKWRKRKAEAEPLKTQPRKTRNTRNTRTEDGTANVVYGKNPQRLGPLTMAAREYGLDRVLDIQQRAGVDLINAEEEGRIREMWALDLWPRKWSAGDIDGDIPLDAIRMDEAGRLIYQALLVK